MKGEPLQPLKKPPPLLLPGKNHPRLMQERVVNRFAKYDNLSGILKRVSDMNLSMDTDEAATESSGRSESSSVRTRSSRSSRTAYTSSCEEPCSPFEDESSASSVSSGPYEEIPTNTDPKQQHRFSSCSSLPSPPPSATTLHSFRDDLPSPPTPTALYSNDHHLRISRRVSGGSQYSNSDVMRHSNSDVTRRRDSDVSSRHRTSRPASLYSNCEPNYSNTRASLYSNTTEPVCPTDVNENQTAQKRLEEGISDEEKHQIEMFFRSLRTDVWVVPCLANMYLSTKGQESGWTFKHTGVPVLIFESGDTKSRDKRRIQIVLAERGTSFPIWRDTIDNLSSYRKSSHAFHTMHLSSDHRQIIGFSFDSAEESEKLLSQIEILTADPENINISMPKKKKATKEKKKKAPLPQKKNISHPCLFEHVTNVAANDKPVYMSLQTLVDKGMIKKPANIA